jgi:hypothetical protein
MLYVFMHLGAFSNRVIRQHMVQCGNYLCRYFQEGPNYVYAGTNDPVTGEPVRKMLSLLPQNDTQVPTAHTLNQQLLKAKSAKIHELSESILGSLAKCLAMDPARRILWRMHTNSSGMKQLCPKAEDETLSL